MTHGAGGVGTRRQAGGALVAEEVVAAGNQSGRHLADAADVTVAVLADQRVRGGRRVRGRGPGAERPDAGRRRGRVEGGRVPESFVPVQAGAPDGAQVRQTRGARGRGAGRCGAAPRAAAEGRGEHDGVGVQAVPEKAAEAGLVHRVEQGAGVRVEQSVREQGVRQTARARPHGDVRLDLPLGGLHALRQARHVEHGLLVPGGRHYVGVRLVLDALDGRALGPHHQAHHSVWHSDLDCHVAWDVSRRSGGRQGPRS